MLVKKILQLPAWLILKGPSGEKTQFDLELFKNHSNELRLCYSTDHEVDIPWQANGEGFAKRDWIFLIENIERDNDLFDAVNWIIHELYEKWNHFENPFENTNTKA